MKYLEIDTCPECGHRMKLIEETHTELDGNPSEYWYECPSCGCCVSVDYPQKGV